MASSLENRILSGRLETAIREFKEPSVGLDDIARNLGISREGAYDLQMVLASRGLISADSLKMYGDHKPDIRFVEVFGDIFDPRMTLDRIASSLGMPLPDALDLQTRAFDLGEVYPGFLRLNLGIPAYIYNSVLKRLSETRKTKSEIAEAQKISRATLERIQEHAVFCGLLDQIYERIGEYARWQEGNARFLLENSSFSAKMISRATGLAPEDVRYVKSKHRNIAKENIALRGFTDKEYRQLINAGIDLLDDPVLREYFRNRRNTVITEECLDPESSHPVFRITYRRGDVEASVVIRQGGFRALKNDKVVSDFLKSAGEDVTILKLIEVNGQHFSGSEYKDLPTLRSYLSRKSQSVVRRTLKAINLKLVSYHSSLYKYCDQESNGFRRLHKDVIDYNLRFLEECFAAKEDDAIRLHSDPEAFLATLGEMELALFNIFCEGPGLTLNSFARRYPTLTHGDLHSGNLFFCDGLIFHDNETAGPGAFPIDLAKLYSDARYGLSYPKQLELAMDYLKKWKGSTGIDIDPHEYLSAYRAAFLAKKAETIASVVAQYDCLPEDRKVKRTVYLEDNLKQISELDPSFAQSVEEAIVKRPKQ